MRGGDAVALGLSNRMFDLVEALPLLEPVQYLLAARFHAEGQHGAVGLAHDRELVDCYRVDAAFAAPAELEPTINHALADRFDTLALKQEVVIGEIDRPVAIIIELLHLGQNVLRRATTPLTIGKRRNVAVDARIGATARGLHGAEAIERQHRRHVERHRFDVVDRQAPTVGKRELVEVLNQRSRRVDHDLAVTSPHQAQHRSGIVKVVQVVG